MKTEEDFNIDNEKARLLAIKKAWVDLVGEIGFLKLNLDNEGFSDWRCRKIVIKSDWEKLYDRFKRGSKMKSGSDLIYAPKALRNLSNNNGWIRIEPDGSNLPVGGDWRWLWKDGTIENYYSHAHKFESNQYLVANFSHYKPIQKELLPIY